MLHDNLSPSPKTLDNAPHAGLLQFSRRTSGATSYEVIDGSIRPGDDVKNDEHGGRSSTKSATRPVSSQTSIKDQRPSSVKTKVVGFLRWAFCFT